VQRNGKERPFPSKARKGKATTMMAPPPPSPSPPTTTTPPCQTSSFSICIFWKMRRKRSKPQNRKTPEGEADQIQELQVLCCPEGVCTKHWRHQHFGQDIHGGDVQRQATKIRRKKYLRCTRGTWQWGTGGFVPTLIRIGSRMKNLSNTGGSILSFTQTKV
jgi:hypothetical protein